MRRSLKRLGVLGAASVFILAACGGSTPTGAPSTEPDASGPAASEASTEPVNLNFWYWAESDAPGANDWLAETVAEYKKVKPNVTVEVVTQATDTLQSAFQTAAASKSGPDIASQWATGPVLDFVWSDSVTAISDLVPAEEMAHWVNNDENAYADKIWAMPMYLLGIDLAYNTELFAKAGVTPPANDQWTWEEFLAASAKLKAAGITPFVGGDKNGSLGAWWFAMIGGQDLDGVNELAQAVVGEVPFTDPKFASPGTTSRTRTSRRVTSTTTSCRLTSTRVSASSSRARAR